MKTDNTLPSGIHDLLRVGGNIAEGLKKHGPWLKMTQTPEGAFRTVLGRVSQTEALYGEARAAKAALGQESIAADKVLTDWLVKTRAVLTVLMGSRWSERWLEVGAAANRCTAIPKQMGPRITLAEGMIDWLAKNSQYGHAAGGITAENGQAIRERLVKVQSDLRSAKAECLTKKRARDSAERALRRKMRQVVVILGISIRADDSRWLDFGLNRPQRSLGSRSVAPASTGSAETGSVLPVTFQTATTGAVEASAAA